MPLRNKIKVSYYAQGKKIQSHIQIIQATEEKLRSFVIKVCILLKKNLRFDTIQNFKSIEYEILLEYKNILAPLARYNGGCWDSIHHRKKIKSLAQW